MHCEQLKIVFILWIYFKLPIFVIYVLSMQIPPCTILNILTISLVGNGIYGEMFKKYFLITKIPRKLNFLFFQDWNFTPFQRPRQLNFTPFRGLRQPNFTPFWGPRQPNSLKIGWKNRWKILWKNSVEKLGGQIGWKLGWQNWLESYVKKV